MRHPPSTLHFSQLFTPRADPGAIEWEELPSLAGVLAARLIASTQRATANAADDAAPTRFDSSGHSVWDATRPAAFDSATSSSPFYEPVSGIAMREVHEPDVFRHFFGT